MKRFVAIKTVRYAGGDSSEIWVATCHNKVRTITRTTAAGSGGSDTGCWQHYCTFTVTFGRCIQCVMIE